MARMLLQMSGRMTRPTGTRILASSNPDSGMRSELIHGKDEVERTVARARSRQATEQHGATAGSDCFSDDCGV